MLHKKRQRGRGYATPPPPDGTYKNKIEIWWEGPRNNVGKIWCPRYWNSLKKKWVITRCYRCQHSVARTKEHLYCNFTASIDTKAEA